ncbi:MAG: hypothetical protein NC205_00980 [Prevotella sp.]|nr:hypothetical protein [Alistipes senegalensis]MCM1357137.1 hypothetical protein [Prevotella sp.]MCM1472648.1 hypothetical protein [Muribaculaceae bacterium]
MHKLEAFGTDYFFQHIFYFIKYKNQQFIYQNYVCNCLKVIAENTARFAGGHTIAKTLNEILAYKPPENKSVGQIIAEITANAGLVAK